ncbi:MAG: site-specific integrase, partial [Planctomycetota bacterium]
MIEEFLNYLKFERHFSPHTAKCYAADLTQFSAFLIGDTAAAAGRQNFTGAAPTSRMSVGGQPTANVGTAVLAEPLLQQKLRDADTEQIKSFLAFLGTQNYSKSTVARKLATLRSFYKFCLRR